jgi:hypothetical protein
VTTSDSAVRRINVSDALTSATPLENSTTNGRGRGLVRQPQAKAELATRCPHTARNERATSFSGMFAAWYDRPGPAAQASGLA